MKRFKNKESGEYAKLVYDMDKGLYGNYKLKTDSGCIVYYDKYENILNDWEEENE